MKLKTFIYLCIGLVIVILISITTNWYYSINLAEDGIETTGTIEFINFTGGDTNPVTGDVYGNYYFRYSFEYNGKNYTGVNEFSDQDDTRNYRNEIRKGDSIIIRFLKSKPDNNEIVAIK